MPNLRRHLRANARASIAVCAAVLSFLTIAGIGAADSPSITNLLQNPSLEQASGATPSCWLLAGYGSNTYQWLRSSDAYDGASAEQLTLSSLNTGDRKLLSAFNSGCSPAVVPGHSYTVSVWYKATTRPAFFAYTNKPPASSYGFWVQSPRLASATSWTQASWTTPVVPAGVGYLSVGLGLDVIGSVTMDGFSLIDNTSTSVADTTPPSSSISCNGASCSSDAYGGAVSVSLSATDNSGGSGVSQIVYTTDGTDPTTTNGSAFGVPFSVAQSSTVRYRAYDKAGNAEAVHAQAIQVDTAAPTVSLTAPLNGATVAGTATLSATAADNLVLRQVDFLVDGQVVATDTALPYTATWNSTSVGNGAHSVAARAVDTAGNQTTSAAATVTVSNGAGTYYGTAPSGNAVGRLGPTTPTGFPRDAATCAATIIRSSWEPRSDNALPNSAKGDGVYVWGPDASDPYWAAFRANVLLVQGQFTGKTTEMFSWAACRWGIDENILRAVGVQESHWHQSSWGDRCNGADPTIGSFGIIQIKNKYCDGSLSEGGMPDTGNSTALALDFYGAKIRSCYDGDFYAGGGWLYGQTVGQIAAANGWDYVLWGCIGYWYSGGWYDSGAKSYITSVKGYLANKTWLTF